MRIPYRLKLAPLWLEALFLLFTAWLALRYLPFPIVKKGLHPKVVPRAKHPSSALQIARIIRSAANTTPFPAVCFPQGITAQRMLCRRGIPATLHYGVRKAQDNKVEAHVWVNVGSTTIIGGEIARDFTLMVSFEPR